MIKYWPIIAGSTSDYVTGGSLSASTPTFTTDRFGVASGAIGVRGTLPTIWTAPPAVYFTGDFTVMLWFKINAWSADWAFLFDFSNGSSGWIDNVNAHYALYGSSTAFNPSMFVMSGTAQSYGEYLSFVFQTSQWYHVAVRLSGTTGAIYVNGASLGDRAGILVPRNLTRRYNYIGGNPSVGQGYANADFDEIRIYNRALSASEIAADYSLNQSLVVQL